MKAERAALAPFLFPPHRIGFPWGIAAREGTHRAAVGVR